MQLELQSLFCPIQANGRVGSYKYVEITPSPLLRNYVSRYWALEPSSVPDLADSDMVDRVVPDGCTDILFEHDLVNNRYRIRYFGILDHPFQITYNEKRPVRKFGIRFFTGGAYPFIQTALAEFSNRCYELNDIWPGFAEKMGKELFDQDSPYAKVRVMEQYLLTIAARSKIASDNLLSNLLYRIFASRGKASVHELAQSEAISDRQMNRKFERWVGFSPKKFSEIVRFQSVVSEISKNRKPDWRMLALEYGFYDQAHFIREFKRFYGESPVNAAKEFQKKV
jgi:AraC-like DNA-binding protein